MYFYMHAGSLNHGCEAIVRSTAKLVNEKITLFSEHPEEDYRVSLNEICDVKPQGGIRSKRNPAFVACKGAEILFKKPDIKHWYAYNKVVNEAREGDLFVSIGGDNYCYGANPYLIYLNKALTKRGARTGLWGCSIEPDVLKDPEIVADMKRYSFISARESITYNALQEAGLENIHMHPDPAFILDQEPFDLPKQFDDGNIVGINLSPLVQRLDKSGRIVYDNYYQLVKYILEKTDMTIAFIPHVCKPGNDDRESMKLLVDAFPDEDRIVMINTEGTMNCMKLKYAISKCRFMITARTHASIAAYSTGIPTLVVGYSVKAKGIARDIFGSEEDYVVDIYKLSSNRSLTNNFELIFNNEKTIMSTINSEMKQYKEYMEDASVLLKDFL